MKKPLNLKKLRKIRSQTFHKKKYKVKVCKLKNAWGECDPPKSKNREIRIDPSHNNEFLLLATLIDEAIHCVDFSIPNARVDKISDAVAKFLIRAGIGLKK